MLTTALIALTTCAGARLATLMFQEQAWHARTADVILFTFYSIGAYGVWSVI